MTFRGGTARELTFDFDFDFDFGIVRFGYLTEFY